MQGHDHCEIAIVDPFRTLGIHRAISDHVSGIDLVRSEVGDEDERPDQEVNSIRICIHAILEATIEIWI